jgi:hypothetical protein
MNPARTINALNRLYALHNRSLPLYLHDAGPWMSREDADAIKTVAHIIEDHQHTVERLGTMILDRDGVLEAGHFPMHYTGWHDLSFDFILNRLIEWQRRAVREIEICARELDNDPPAKAVAEEILGQAKGHLDSLVELVGGSRHS